MGCPVVKGAVTGRPGEARSHTHIKCIKCTHASRYKSHTHSDANAKRHGQWMMIHTHIGERNTPRLHTFMRARSYARTFTVVSQHTRFRRAKKPRSEGAGTETDGYFGHPVTE